MLTEMEYILLVANVGAYILLAIGFSTKRNKFPKDATLEESFTILEEKISKFYPDMPEGYTWNEFLTKLKGSSAKAKRFDWPNIEKSLKQYEAFRYGGIDYKDADPRTVLRLAQKLPRGEEVVR